MPYPKSILDEPDIESLLEEQEQPVTAATLPTPVVSPSVSILDDTVEANKQGMMSKIKETYNKTVQWASTPKKISEAKPVQVPGVPFPMVVDPNILENIGKGTVGLGIGMTELVKMELGGVKEWLTRPKESLMALKETPGLVGEMIVLPILQDIKELFTHPIKYTYEKPIQQLLNLSIITGIGTGMKGIQEAGKIKKATSYMTTASNLIRSGETELGQIALDAAKGTMGTLRKPGIRTLSPRYAALAEELEYQRWLQTYSPISSRGVTAAVTREVRPASKAQQLGKWASKVEGEKIPVTYVGIQKMGEGFPDVKLVNLPNKSTVAFDPLKHTMIEQPMAGGRAVGKVTPLIGKEGMIELEGGYRVPLEKMKQYRKIMQTIEETNQSDYFGTQLWANRMSRLEDMRQKLHNELRVDATASKYGDKVRKWFEGVTTEKPPKEMGQWNKTLNEVGDLIEETAYPKAGGLVHTFPEKLVQKGVTVTGRGDMFRLPEDMKVTDIYGNKVTLIKGHEFTEYKLSNNQVWIHDGKNVVLNKNQLQNLKAQSLTLGEKQLFTPEEAAITTIIKKGPSGKFEGEPIGPKFSEYVVPGGKNYREILFQAPQSENFAKANLKPGEVAKGLEYRSPHWEEPNIISHARVTDRVTPEGKKIMFIEEIQSDIAKDIRKYGAKLSDTELTRLAELQKMLGTKNVAQRTEMNTLLARHMSSASVSDIGMKNWQEFTLKKLVKQAIDEGYDGISWASGKQVADMYNLAKRVDEVSFSIQPGSAKGVLSAYKTGIRDPVIGKEVAVSELDKYIGKDVAAKIQEGLKTKKTVTLKGQDLEVGGEWAKNLYDKQIPNILKDLTKQEARTIEMKGKVVKVSSFHTPEQVVKGFKGKEDIFIFDPDAGIENRVMDLKTLTELLEDYPPEDFYVKIKTRVPLEQSYLPLTKEVKAKVVGEAPTAGGKGVVPPKPPTAVGDIPELPPSGQEKTVFEQIREQAYADAPEVIPEGKLDAMNYERYLREKASGPIKKIVVKSEYQGDYYSLKPAVAALSKATADTPNMTAALANHWMENLYAMKHPEHEQSFIAKVYRPQGEVPRFPERVYPWIKIKTKAPIPQGESNLITRKAGSPGQVMRDAWGLENPLVDAFEAGQTAGINTDYSFKWFKSLTKGVRSDSKLVKQRMQPFIQEHVSLSRKFELTTDEAMKKSLSDMIIKNYKEAFDFQVKLAETSSDVRIAMYAEDILPAFLLPRMAEKEIKIGEMIKAYYTKTAADMQRVDLPILSKQAYTRHIIAQEMKEAMGNWNNIPDYIKKHIPADMAFAHRSGEFNWFPSITAQLTDYIPVVERKLAFQPYLLHWKDTVDQAAKVGNRAGIEAAEMIKRNIYRGAGVSEKISNAITSTNYFLQLFANARVAMKHIIGGFPGAISEVGIWNTPGTVYQMLMHPLQSREMIKTFGRLRDIVKTLEVTSGIEVQSSRILRALQGQPTIAAEYVEQGINIMGNLMKGGAKGIDPELLRSYIWNKVTSVNFRGGWDIPKVFANPAGRVVFQYSLEPHKVWEYRLELVRRAMAGERDIYGTPYGSKLIQYIAILGASEGLARAHGKTLMDTIAGTPYIDFISPKKDFPYVDPQMKVKLGPGVKLLADVSKDVARGDILHVTDEFVNYILESGVGLLGQLSKVSSGKIPDYYESATDYLLGFPEVEELERMNSRTTRYLEYRTEKDELLRERNLIRKNPTLKHFILFKRDFRKSLRKFLDSPDEHFEEVYGNQTQTSILDEPE